MFTDIWKHLENIDRNVHNDIWYDEHLRNIDRDVHKDIRQIDKIDYWMERRMRKRTALQSKDDIHERKEKWFENSSPSKISGQMRLAK